MIGGIFDPDGHGFTCAVNFYQAHVRSGYGFHIFSTFSTSSPLRVTQRYIPRIVHYLRKLGCKRVLIVDMKISNVERLGDVEVLDHGEDGKVKTALDLCLYPFEKLGIKPNERDIEWAIAGAVMDNDPSVASLVSRELEYDICNYLDQLIKRGRSRMCIELLGDEKECRRLEKMHGDMGKNALAVAEKELTVRDLIYMAKKLGLSLPDVDEYDPEEMENIIYIDHIAPSGNWWKTCWKLSYVTGRPVTCMFVHDVDTRRPMLIVSTYWRTQQHVISIIDSAIMDVFMGYPIGGRPRMRKILTGTRIEKVHSLVKTLDREITERLKTLSTSNAYGDDTARHGTGREQGWGRRRWRTTRPNI